MRKILALVMALAATPAGSSTGISDVQETVRKRRYKMTFLRCLIVTCVLTLAAGTATAQPNGTNGRMHSLVTGRHVYCPEPSPYRYCKPPKPNQPAKPKIKKNYR